MPTTSGSASDGLAPPVRISTKRTPAASVSDGAAKGAPRRGNGGSSRRQAKRASESTKRAAKRRTSRFYATGGPASATFRGRYQTLRRLVQSPPSTAENYVYRPNSS